MTAVAPVEVVAHRPLPTGGANPDILSLSADCALADATFFAAMDDSDRRRFGLGARHLKPHACPSLFLTLRLAASLLRAQARALCLGLRRAAVGLLEGRQSSTDAGSARTRLAAWALPPLWRRAAPFFARSSVLGRVLALLQCAE